MNLEPESDDVLERIFSIWESARTQAARTVNTVHVCANWRTGQQIVEAEQAGTARAGYGTQLLERLSARLSAEYGTGFSVSVLRYMRLFYQGYPNLLPIHHALRDESIPILRNDWKPGCLHPALAWTHYRALLKVDRREARDFYEIETIKNGWSSRQLERQINTLLFDRLLKSRDQEGILELANAGQTANHNDAMVRYVLDEKNSQIFASRYQLHLPTEDQLRSELKREWEKLLSEEEAQ